MTRWLLWACWCCLNIEIEWVITTETKYSTVSLQQIDPKQHLCQTPCLSILYKRTYTKVWKHFSTLFRHPTCSLGAPLPHPLLRVPHVDKNGRFDRRKKNRFLTCVSCFGTLRGRGPFRSRCLSRRKSGTDGKAINGISSYGRRWKGPRSVATQLWFTEAKLPGCNTFCCYFKCSFYCFKS